MLTKKPRAKAERGAK